VPKEGLRIQDVLVRLAILHLIHNKVCVVFFLIFNFIYFMGGSFFCSYLLDLLLGVFK
jgi:hypothetical protein